MVYFFRAGTLFCTENAKCWPRLANFDYFVSNVCTFRCTFAELNNAVVPQNWQISDRRLITFVAIAMSKTSSSNSSCLAKTWSGVRQVFYALIYYAIHFIGLILCRICILIQTNTWKTWIIFETTSSEKLTVELSQGLITWKFTENLTMMKILRMMPAIYQDLLKCYQMKKNHLFKFFFLIHLRIHSPNWETWDRKSYMGQFTQDPYHMCANIIQQF